MAKEKEQTYLVAPTVQPGDSIVYGDWRDSEGAHTWYDNAHVAPGNILGAYVAIGTPLTVIPYTLGSGYSGNLVEISNAIVLKERFPWLIEIRGGHGTRGVAYLGKRENQNPELIEAIEDLESYPLFDKDHHSHLEMDTAEAAWVEDGRKDFKRALVKYFDALYAPDEHDADLMSDDAVDRLWYDATERLNGGESHLNEQGDSIYFPISDIVEKFTRNWPGMLKPGYDGGESLDAQLLALAEAATIRTERCPKCSGDPYEICNFDSCTCNPPFNPPTTKEGV